MIRIKISENIFINCQGKNTYNKNICNGCKFREPFIDRCKIFSVKLDKNTQRNGGFNHTRCIQCINSEKIHDNLFNNEEKQKERFQIWNKRKRELEIELYNHNKNEF